MMASAPSFAGSTMIKTWFDWLDHRTGCRRFVDAWRHHTVPGGPRWSRVIPVCLLWMLIVEVVTGVLLMATYSPSTNNAWASVYYIEQMVGGRFIRGLHYFAGQAMLILFGVHVLRVLIIGAFKAPRELIWATGLLLIPLTLIWAVTGNPLRWNQEGYGQIQVEGNILASTPIIGPVLRSMLIGGEELGHLTLTRLYTLHVVVIPAFVGLLLVVHITQVYRHGLFGNEPGGPVAPATPYFPHQSLRNMSAVLLLVGIVSVLAVRHGAPLGIPADPTLPSEPRPEWYFLFLFELRRYVAGDWEVLATLVIPSAVLILLLALPSLDYRCPVRFRRALRALVVLITFGGWTGLTVTALVRDWGNEQYQKVSRLLEELGARAHDLAREHGIPPEGPIWLLRNDPQTRGAMLFEEHCAACHRFGDRFVASEKTPGDQASDLAGFGTAAWIRELIENPGDSRFLGQTKHTGMIKWAKSELGDLDETQKAELDRITRWLANHPRGLPKDGEQSEFATSFQLFDAWCIRCHPYEGLGGSDQRAPDFTGYGSVEWIRGMLLAPESTERYGKRCTMPSFQNTLSLLEIDMVARWIVAESAARVETDLSPSGPNDATRPAVSEPPQ
jgi:ubiquinol-cytochrome c reductase cytochrome b subunit